MEQWRQDNQIALKHIFPAEKNMNIIDVSSHLNVNMETKLINVRS